MCSPPTNAIDGDLIGALTELVRRFEHGSARVLVLSSAVPGWFADGHSGLLERGSVEYRADHHAAVRAPLDRLASCRRPSIAAIDGRATGLGLELALACTLRACSPASRVGFPQPGYVPAAGGTQRLPRLVGAGRALDLLFTGRLVAGDEALRVGLVEHLFYRDVVEQSLAIARAIASSSAPAAALLIECVEAAFNLPHHEGVSVERAALLSLMEDGSP
jgi:enoyl-CoA hydratase